MANLSKLGNKKILGGFVGNKRILEECVYVNKTYGKIHTDLIPYTFTLDDQSPGTFGTVENIGIKSYSSVNEATRTISFSFALTLNKDGMPLVDGHTAKLITGNFTKTYYVKWDYYDEFNKSVLEGGTGGTATYTQSEWNSFYYETVVKEKKIIYQMIPYAWKSTANSTNDFVADDINQLNTKYPPCEPYKDKTARVQEEGNSWASITEDEYLFLYGEGYGHIEYPSGDNPPNESYLPDANSYDIQTVAVVYDNQDNAVFFKIVEGHGGYTYKYYKCLPV